MHVQLSLINISVNIEGRMLIIKGKLDTQSINYLNIEIPINIDVNTWSNIHNNMFIKKIALAHNMRLYPMGKNPAIINTSDCILICLKSEQV